MAARAAAVVPTTSCDYLSEIRDQPFISRDMGTRLDSLTLSKEMTSNLQNHVYNSINTK